MVKVALHQFELGRGDFWNRTKRAMIEASAQGAHFYVQPELSSYEMLYPDQLPTNPSELMAVTASYAPEYIDEMRSLAQVFGLYVIAGSIPVLREDGLIYNIAPICAPDGQIFYQGKCHMTKWERALGVTPYPDYSVFHTDLGSFALAICYDVEIPELVRNAGRQGATFLLVPTFTDSVYGCRRVNRTAAAAAEYNQMYVLTCGVCGMIDTETIGPAYAQSNVFAPSYPDFPEDGIVSMAPVNEDHLIVAELDLDTLQRSRNLYDVSPLRDSANSALIPAKSVSISHIYAGAMQSGSTW